MPFAGKDDDGVFSLWNVPPTDDYGLACVHEYEYAGHYLQYLKNNPRAHLMNTLGRIARDIEANTTANNGYSVGFCTALERFMFLALNAGGKPFAVTDMLVEQHDRIASNRAKESAGVAA